MWDIFQIGYLVNSILSISCLLYTSYIKLNNVYLRIQCDTGKTVQGHFLNVGNFIGKLYGGQVISVKVVNLTAEGSYF